MVTLGTGIGGALILDGEVLRGYNGMAGEFGHNQVVPGGRPCECGGTGCWEQYCSGNALTRFVRDAGRRGPAPGPAITAAARGGRPGRAGGVRGRSGSGSGSAWPTWWRRSTRRSWSSAAGCPPPATCCSSPRAGALRESLVGAAHRTVPPVVRAALGPEAGAIGAADLARQRFRSAGTRARARRRAARGTARRR